MDERTNDQTPGGRNDSEPVRNRTEITANDVPNASEQVRNPSERVLNQAEPLPNNIQNSSEPVRNTFEQAEIIKAVPIRTVRNASEAGDKHLDTVPNASEHVQPAAQVGSEQGDGGAEAGVQEESERFRTAPLCSESHEQFTITIREAARLFEEAGVPRTERAITKWCNLNARGVTRLDCCYSEAERKYYITPESIERVTIEERKKFQYVEYRNGGVLSTEAEGLAEQLRAERFEGSERSQNEGETTVKQQTDARTAGKQTEEPASPKQREEPHQTEAPRGGNDPTAPTDMRAELKRLQLENYELKVQLEGQKFLVMKFDDLVDGERQRHQEEKLALVDRLTEARHQIGTLEQKLLQLEAPRPAVREAETG
jgi:hypothetical protein